MDGLDELGHRNRLRQIGSATALTDTLLVAVHRKGGHRNYRNGLQFGIFVQPLGDFETGDFRQLNVHQDQIRTVFTGEIGDLEAVARADGTIAVSRSWKSFMLSSLSSTIITVFDISQPSGKPPRRATVRGGALATTLGKTHGTADLLPNCFPVGCHAGRDAKTFEPVPPPQAQVAVRPITEEGYCAQSIVL